MDKSWYPFPILLDRNPFRTMKAVNTISLVSIAYYRTTHGTVHVCFFKNRKAVLITFCVSTFKKLSHLEGFRLKPIGAKESLKNAKFQITVDSTLRVFRYAREELVRLPDELNTCFRARAFVLCCRRSPGEKF